MNADGNKNHDETYGRCSMYAYLSHFQDLYVLGWQWCVKNQMASQKCVFPQSFQESGLQHCCLSYLGLSP